MKTKSLSILIALFILLTISACETSSLRRTENTVGAQPLIPPSSNDLQTTGAHITALALRPDGEALALAAGNTDAQGHPLLEIWATTSRQISDTLAATGQSIASLAFSPDGRWLASAGRANNVTLWDFAPGAKPVQSSLAVAEHDAATQTISALTFSPDGRWLAAEGEHTLWIWAVATARLVQTLPAQSPLPGEADAVAFSPDSMLVAARHDHTITLWRVTDGKAMATFPATDSGLCGLTFSPVDPVLATCLRNGNIQLVHTPDGKVIATLANDPNATLDITFSPDGKFLVAIGVHGAGGNGTAELPITTLSLWRVRDGQSLGRFEVVTGQIYERLAISSNGQALALFTKNAGAVHLTSFADWLAKIAAGQCPAQQADATGYLQKICIYLVTNGIDVTPGDPAHYQIRTIEERTAAGRPVLWVFLNCCHMGDIAIIDKATGAVIDFRASAE